MNPVMLWRNTSGMSRRLHSWMNWAPFDGLLGEQDPVVAEHADREPVDRSPTAHELVAVERLELLEATAVEQPGEHLADVERDAHVGRRAAEQLGRVVERRVGGLGGSGPSLRHPRWRRCWRVMRMRVELVLGEVVGQATRARVHLGAAERLLVDLLVDGHLHERRAAEVGGAALLDEDRVVAHAGHVGAAGRVRPNATVIDGMPSFESCVRSWKPAPPG
jgi:hypothetical protein